MPAVPRKPNRMPDYDYADFGRYFITIITFCRQHIFWMNDELENAPRSNPPILSSIGNIVRGVIRRLPDTYPGLEVDIFSIMPDHIHLLLVLRPTPEYPDKAAKGIPVIVQQLKRKCSLICKRKLWQRDYYDRVIRSDEEYGSIWNYIDNNLYWLLFRTPIRKR